MEIQMQQANSAEGLAHSKWDFAIVGEPLDDRGNGAMEFVKKNCTKVLSIKYFAGDLQMEVDGNKYDIDDVDEAFKLLVGKTVLIESTALGFVEILLSTQAAKNIGAKNISFLYIEPANYKIKQKSFLHRREFDLSGEVVGYRPVPPYIKSSTGDYKQKVVFFPGFEASRMDRAFEDNSQINARNCSLVFGVPAFQAGWEMNAFANNIDVIRERKISGGIYYCGATDPLGAFSILEKIKKSLNADEELLVAPIGTKPSGIGAALFIISNTGIGLLYDHPKKENKRSDKIASWHLFNVTF